MPGITAPLRALRIDGGFFHKHLAHIILPFAKIEPGLREGRRKENKRQSQRPMDQANQCRARSDPNITQPGFHANVGLFGVISNAVDATARNLRAKVRHGFKHLNKSTPRLSRGNYQQFSSSRAPGVVPSIARRNDARAWRSGDPSSRRW